MSMTEALQFLAGRGNAEAKGFLAALDYPYAKPRPGKRDIKGAQVRAGAGDMAFYNACLLPQVTRIASLRLSIRTGIGTATLTEVYP
jgi:hypothetical protein